jgi:ribosomal protein S18 acetylase RimI-like enzyme
LAGWSTRNGSEQDIAAVLELWRSAGGPAGATDTRAALEHLLRHDPGSLLLADCDGVLVGSLIAVWDGWRGNVYRLVVSRDRRRAGIATSLLREGERHLHRRGARRISAIVADCDPVAVDFWRAAGYRRQADRARFVREIEP